MVAETAEKVECSPLRVSVWSERVWCGESPMGRCWQAPWGMLACGYCLTSALGAVQVGRITAQCGVKDGGLWGVTLLGTPIGLLTAVLMVRRACCMPQAPWAAGRGGSCLEGGDSAPREGNPLTGAVLQQRARSLLVEDFSWCPNMVS